MHRTTALFPASSTRSSLSLSSLTIAQRFWSWAAFATLLFYAGMYLGWSGLGAARDSLRRVHDDGLMQTVAIAQIESSINEGRRQLLLAFQHAPDSPTVHAHDHPVARHFEAVAEADRRMEAAWQQVSTRVNDERERPTVAAVGEHMLAWRAERDAVVAAVQRGDYGTETVKRYLAASSGAGESALAALGVLREAHIQRTRQEYERAEQRHALTQQIDMGLILLGALGGTAMGLSTLSRLKRGFASAQSTARSIAAGDLTCRIEIDRDDEIAQLLRSMAHMQTSLQTLVAQVRGSTDSISATSEEITAGSLNLSGRTEQAAANLQQTASSMHDLASAVHHSADSARQASALAASASQIARRGGEVVSQVVSTMDEINASSRKIGDITGMIDSIAFRTNLLALNAAVEAARAGEHGRGFAVVAGEVRSLARQSAEAAREIKGLIGESVVRVESGARLVGDAGATMDEIVASVQRVADIVDEISSAAQAQNQGIERVNGAVDHLDATTQQNAALVEQSAAAAQSLRDQAHKLGDVMAAFRIEAEKAMSQPA